MLRLVLVRHAKSAWDDPGLADLDRPLAGRGLEAAAWIGDRLKQKGIVADRILCSPARRTRETVELLLARLEASRQLEEVVWDGQLYMRRDDDYVDAIGSEGGDAKVLMVVGHNPATEVTAGRLVGDSIKGRFPTGGIAVIDCDIARWAELAPASGVLTSFWRPPKR